MNRQRQYPGDAPKTDSIDPAMLGYLVSAGAAWAIGTELDIHRAPVEPREARKVLDKLMTGRAGESINFDASHLDAEGEKHPTIGCWLEPCATSALGLIMAVSFHGQPLDTRTVISTYRWRRGRFIDVGRFQTWFHAICFPFMTTYTLDIGDTPSLARLVNAHIPVS